MRIEKKTGNLGCFVCPLPVFFSLNYQLFLATLPEKVDPAYSQLGLNHEPIYSYICRQIADIGILLCCNFHLHKIQDGAFLGR